MPIICGDCKEVVKRMDENSIDSIVTDPPAGIAFMNKEWDKNKGGRDQWIEWMAEIATECLRVIKPGGHALVWALPRTSHWTATAWENGGFEVRDKIDHVFGSGFPKSLDISKAIDKNAPRIGQFEAFADHFVEQRKIKELSQKEIAINFPSKTGGITGCVWNWENGMNVPTLDQWKILQPLLNLSLEYLPLIERIEAERDVIGISENGIAGGTHKLAGEENAWGFNKDYDITIPSTDAAKQWNGWGTALKPAHEDWILLRKPLEGTVAQNVLKWGVGGINIDGCRVEIQDTDDSIYAKNPHTNGTIGENGIYGAGKKTLYKVPTGRFPANLIHDGSDEVLALFPQSSITGNRHIKNRDQQNTVNTPFTRGMTAPEYTDSGSAARFFYCAKPSKSERNIGCEDLPQKTAGECTDRVEGSAGLNSPRAGAGRTSGSQNDHPTVKSINLMCYLCKLITPPNGIILDPFCGSGSTGLAAYLEGFQCIMIDKDPHSCEIAEARMKGIIKENNKN